MAKRRAKKKRMTITEMFNRYAIGLQYYGESIPTKKRATRKQLKEIKKLSSQLRQEQREQGITDLPTIAQAYSQIMEQEKQSLAKMLENPFADDELEPLPYSDEPLDISQYEYPVIEEFQALMLDVVDYAEDKFNYLSAHNNPYITISTQVAQIEERLAQIMDSQDLKSSFADYLSKSPDFEELKNFTMYDYDDLEGYLDRIHSNMSAIIETFFQRSPQFIAPTDIQFDV